MNLRVWLFLCATAALCLLLLHNASYEEGAVTYLDSSVPYVGADAPKNFGYNGLGVKIAVIDTGIDASHPDLFGFGPGSKVQGKNFVDRNSAPLDVNGHGTQVAGIVAADGQLQGIAPKSTLYAYKVSNDGNAVSSDLIVEAIRQAIADRVDIINISLGVNRINHHIDAAVNDAAREGIVVVVAAGNDGPERESIGSPGINPNAITVGATYNNRTASMVGTLKVNGEFFEAIPMIGTEPLEEPIAASLAFGRYAKVSDFEAGNFVGKVVLAERGSDVEGETIYFSDKELNAANAGASALLVYNSMDGIFLGELLHEFTASDYTPQIPVLSISREDGLAIREMLDGATAVLHVFNSPDFVAHFSSRGPVSPFYTKPDMVAPGVFVNSTFLDGGYSYTAGTSFATPHVSGAAALLLAKNPELTPEEIKSIIVTTTDPISDEQGNFFPVEFAGSGRLNVTRAFDADLIVSPTMLTFDITPRQNADTEKLALAGATISPEDLTVSVLVPGAFEANYEITEGEVVVTIRQVQNVTGAFSGRVLLVHDSVQYNVPFIIRATEGSVAVSDDTGTLSFEVDAPGWSFAKIYIISPSTGYWETASVTPDRSGLIMVHEPGKYWIEAKIVSGNRTYNAYGSVDVEKPAPRDAIGSLGIDLPSRQLIILAGVTASVAIAGVLISRRR